MSDWLTLILLGLAAGFMPLVFGLEIALMSIDDGGKRATSLVGGVTVFRLLVAIGAVMVFAAGAAAFSQGISNITDFLGSTLSQFGQDVTSGQHIILDILFIAAGALLIRDAYRHIRSSPSANQPSADQVPDDGSSSQQESKALKTGVVGMIGIGLTMTATNAAQWVFMSTAVSQILHMPINLPERLLAFSLFMVAASVMILLPLIVLLVLPKQSQEVLTKIGGWIHGSMKYIVAGMLFLIGLYLFIKGAIGMVQYF